LRVSASHPSWVTVFLDLEATAWERGTSFWAQVTGSELSALRGEDREFGTLLPADGDPHLAVQRRVEGSTRVHLDLHVPDPVAAAGVAVGLGAREVHRSEFGYVVLDSPGGLPFCFVSHPAATRTRPVTWPTGHRSLLDQVCLDVGPGAFDAEVAFWAALTGWEPAASRSTGDFVPLTRPTGQPWRFLLQRTHDEQAAGAHLDLGTDDRTAEVERHVALGARVEAQHGHWTVLHDPVGTTYCVTDRDPETGVLAPVASA
jgi:hypothetical protein